MINDILCIGEVLIDGISTEVTSDLEHANSLEIVVGGSVANFNHYLNKLGVSATLVASIGNDGFGKKIIETLKTRNVNIDHINILNEHNTSFIAVSKTPETPDFIAYRDADRIIEKVDEGLIAHAKLVHSTAFSLSQLPASKTILDTFEKAHQLNKLISIDWNYAPSIWKNKAYANEIFKTIQKYKLLLKLSIDDISRFLDKQVTEQQAMDFLNDVSATCVCLTCGSKGVYFKSEGKEWNFSPAKKIEIKNATGAGDSFWAGFIAHYLQTSNIEISINNGIETASLKLQNLL
ncbi:MAG: carbohydrate kinase family protein [Chitinophagaceae bacterium]